jgi:hypothetical protein
MNRLTLDMTAIRDAMYDDRERHGDALSVGAGGKLTPLRRLRIDPLGRWRRCPGAW